MKPEELVPRLRDEADKLPNLLPAGRLGCYRYWDMDCAVAKALAVFKENNQEQ